MEAERATSKIISLYPRHINAVKRFQDFKKFKGESEAYQYIIDDFFEDKSARNDFILYFFVPLVFVILTTIVNLSTGHVYNILLKQGLFFDDLFILSQVFLIISFGSIGVLIASVYYLRCKLKGEKFFKKELISNGVTDQ